MAYVVIGILVLLLYELNSIRHHASETQITLQKLQQAFEQQLRWYETGTHDNYGGTFAHNLKDWIGKVESNTDCLSAVAESLSQIETNTHADTDGGFSEK